MFTEKAESLAHTLSSEAKCSTRSYNTSWLKVVHVGYDVACLHCTVVQRNTVMASGCSRAKSGMCGLLLQPVRGYFPRKTRRDGQYDEACTIDSENLKPQ